jgi:hypothetical protein
MKKINQYSAIALLGMIPLTASAQDEAVPQGYSYVTYYVCDMAEQANMDNIVENNEVAVFDKWVEDGKLLSWGYLSHFVGGRWRRAQYHVSATLEEALNNQRAILSEVYADNRAGGQARAEACAAHDDYLWTMDQGSPPGTDRADVSLSVYFECSVADQRRADEIFAQTFAPKLTEMQEQGKIATWGWQSHVLGGKYRRLQTVTGADHASVTAARFEALQHVNQNHSAMGREFSQICDSHTDYLWDIVHESP